jgi:hypothetical protein
VDLVEIDVVGLEAPEARLDLAHDVDPRGPRVVEVAVAHGEACLRGEHYLPSDAFEGVADEALALPPAVDVGRVDEVDALVQGETDHLGRGLLVQVAYVHLAAELHRSERELAYDKAGVAQSTIFHASPPISFITIIPFYRVQTSRQGSFYPNAEIDRHLAL